MSEPENPRHILVVANETVVSKALVDLIEETGEGRERARDGARAGEPAAPGLRRLLRHAPRRSPAAPRQDARPAARGRRARERDRRRDRSRVRAPRRDRPARAGRGHRLDAPAAEVGLAAAQRRRADAPRRRRPPVPSTSSSTSRPSTARRTCSSSRTRRCSARRSSTRSASARQQSPAELPDHLAAGRLRGKLRGGREAPAARGDAAAQRGHRGARPDLASRSVRGGACRRSRTSASTRSSSRRSPDARSGWLRRDLLERLRAETKLPIEHVEVDVPAEVTRLMARLARRARSTRRARAPARAALLLADLAEHPRHVPLHRVGDHALRRVLHGVLLRARRDGHGRGRRRRSTCRSSSRSSTPASS